MRQPIQLIKRMYDFPRKPWRARVDSYLVRWKRLFPNTPAPIRFRDGLWWTLDMDFVDTSMLNGGYEKTELLFISNFVKPGMTVLDIGAHRGLHSIVLSKRVGRRGRVVAFEPSARNVKRLKLHLRMNLCRNVEVRECALGDRDRRETLYEVPANSVLNSLRPPDTGLTANPTTVQSKRLDDMLHGSRIRHVDFLKLDVEGGELAVFEGAPQLLANRPRPVILCEVLDLRTRPWGYPARLILQHLTQREFTWFSITPQGTLLPLKADSDEFDGNFVAIPAESLPALADLHSQNALLQESTEGQAQNEAVCHSLD